MTVSPDRSDQTKRAVGHRIRIERTRRPWTQLELAQAAGVNRGFLSRVESGTAAPSVDWLVLVADALGVPVTRLLEDVPAPTGQWSTAPA